MNVLNAAIYTTLQAGTALTALLAGTTSAFPMNIYHLQAQDNAPLPYVVFSIQAGGDENQTPKRRKNNLLYIRGYSDTSAANAGSIDTEIDALLNGQAITSAGWANIYTRRENDIELIENLPSGEKIYCMGGFYRMRNEQN